MGEGALRQIGETIANFRPGKILLVLGKSSFRRSPHYRGLAEGLRNFDVLESPAVEPNPTVAFVEEALGELKSARCGLVIGVGGGSVLDFAKTAAAYLAQDGGTLAQYAEGRKEFQRPPLPLIAVPTTAGTGSEVTPYASLQTADKMKTSLEHTALFPSVALIDPELTHSMSAYVTACTGLDALCQAVESYWSVRNTPFSQTHSLQAIALVLENLETAVREPGNAAARFAMALGSSEAGLAIAQTRTTAVHAVSYPLTSYFGIPHGHACAVTLASFIRYNASVLNGSRGALLWVAMAAETAQDAALKVERLMQNVGLERSLSKLGLNKSGIETVVQNGFRPDRVKNNPRELKQEELREMLLEIF